MDGKTLFRRDIWRRGGGWLRVLVRPLTLEIEVDDGKVECLWVRIRRKVNKTNILVEIFNR